VAARSSSGKGRKYVLVMVGLPARGKTHTGQKLSRYLSWLGYPTCVYNVGERRRTDLGTGQSHEFFDPRNEEGERVRERLAISVLDEMLDWLGKEGRVGIYDATNTTRERRRYVRERSEAAGFEVIFIEIVTRDEESLETTIRETKLSSPDYVGFDADQAVQDFRARIAHYESVYETVSEDEGPFVRLIERGQKVEMNRIHGYLTARIVFFLINARTSTRQIWLTRHGQSEFNVKGLIGGDSPLSADGREYAKNLAAHTNERFDADSPLEIWTSTLRRTIETARPLGREALEWRSLDEIDAGVCDSMSYEQILDSMPHEFNARAEDKLGYRYSRGESYQDVIQRLDRVIIELERYRTPVLVIGHQAVHRALYAYFMDLPRDECPHVPIPLHTIIQLTPKAYRCAEERIALPPRVAGGSSS
jgi:broad specificity phosphatase PhoE/adenylylsulfate kinase-like enzyme